MYSLLGVGGHPESGEMGELWYTLFRYIRYLEMTEEVTGGQLVVGGLEMSPAHNQHTIHYGIILITYYSL